MRYTPVMTNRLDEVSRHGEQGKLEAEPHVRKPIEASPRHCDNSIGPNKTPLLSNHKGNFRKENVPHGVWTAQVSPSARTTHRREQLPQSARALCKCSSGSQCGVKILRVRGGAKYGRPKLLRRCSNVSHYAANPQRDNSHIRFASIRRPGLIVLTGVRSPSFTKRMTCLHQYRDLCRLAEEANDLHPASEVVPLCHLAPRSGEGRTQTNASRRCPRPGGGFPAFGCHLIGRRS